jgi:hypothetical protein
VTGTRRLHVRSEGLWTDLDQDFTAVDHVDRQPVTAQHAHSGQDIAVSRAPIRPIVG